MACVNKNVLNKVSDMSGGSLDYVCYKVEGAISDISSRTDDKLCRVFVKHLKDVANALHEIEWWLSSDCGYDRAEIAIKECMGSTCKVEVASLLIEDLERIKTEAQLHIDEIKDKVSV